MNQKDITRTKSIDLAPDEFKKIGYLLVDKIADFFNDISNFPVTKAEDQSTIRGHLKSDAPLAEEGTDPQKLMNKVSELLIQHSLFNGHPRFWGYITSSAAPLGILGDLLSSAINANVGAWALSPMASEIEAQTIRWIGSFIGFPSRGGLIVSGGNVANYIGFLAASRAKTGLKIRERGIKNETKDLILYCSQETHTWVQKAADLFGLGTDNIRWIETDRWQKINLKLLKESIEKDVATGFRPFLVIGNAGSVSTGVVDPLDDIADICDHHDLWFHIDGAYGGFAAAIPELMPTFEGLSRADSIAIDPHKWLYAPLEAGCILVKDPSRLTDTFSYHPPYYNFEQSVMNYVDYGIQNSRGFKALKVWLTFQQIGSRDYRQLIREDIMLAKATHRLLSESNRIQTFTNNLSITTFRYLPPDLNNNVEIPAIIDYLNDLNRRILEKIEKSGKFYVSNAMIHQNFVLRMCIVNFRTKIEDIIDFISFLLQTGDETDSEMRSDHLK